MIKSGVSFIDIQIDMIVTKIPVLKSAIFFYELQKTGDCIVLVPTCNFGLHTFGCTMCNYIINTPIVPVEHFNSVFKLCFAWDFFFPPRDVWLSQMFVVR